MKKRYILVSALLAFISFSLKAQKDTSLFKKKEINKTDIEVLYSQYNQDGQNSAVTGGIGTEKLMVYAPSLKISKQVNSNTFTLKTGADIISSASTDNIDYIVSSASRRDTRLYSNIGFGHNYDKKRIGMSAGTGFSIESDYASIPLNVGLKYSDKKKMRSYYLNILMNFDDLRWGRLNEDYYHPEKLIYPSELRNREWHENYLRQSYNFRFGFTQILNKRNILGLYPEFTIQNGLLSTPFHRVYFDDNSLKVEKLPDQRLKALLGLKLNSFVSNNVILKNRIDLYSDNFGIAGIVLENETILKLSSRFSISPTVRLDIQKGSKYFAPYMMHTPDKSFYTSDYDLSSLRTYQLGLGLRYLALKSLKKNLLFDEVKLRYAYYFRSNQLHAHIISCAFGLTQYGKSKK